MNIYKPREFGALIGRAVITLQSWDRKGILKAHRTPTGKRFYTHEQYLEYMAAAGNPVDALASKRKRVAYCRVSGSGQRKDLEAQKRAVEAWNLGTGQVIDEWVEDIGSGLNYDRKGFVRLMEQVEAEEIGEIILAHQDRLVRFGWSWFERFCEAHGTKLVVMGHESLSPQEEVTKDLMKIIENFSPRVYGLRRYGKEVKKIVETVEGGRPEAAE
ncbi:MAG: IS607 family transposase [Acidobacteria bacterium]|nr:IS607 family transposase [Acidobacteriota bacterium]